MIDSNGNTVWSQVYNQPTTDGERIVFDTGTISGEYVKIQKNDSNFLHLAEVQVFDYTPVTRVDPTVDFNWGYQGSPAPGIQGANWAASWQGTVTADYSEDYTFYATADDGVRLWVNGQLLCDGWQPEGATEYSGTIHLEAGQSYSIQMEYYQVNGPESAKLEWSSASQAREVIPASNLSCANLLGEENVGPVNTVPGEQSETINQPVVFSTDNGNAIQVSDANSATSPVFASSFEDPNLGWGVVSGGYNGGGNEGGWNLTFLGRRGQRKRHRRQRQPVRQPLCPGRLTSTRHRRQCDGLARRHLQRSGHLHPQFPGRLHQRQSGLELVQRHKSDRRPDRRRDRRGVHAEFQRPF